MPRTTAAGLLFIALLGVAVVGYMVTQVPPTQPSGDLDFSALLPFFLGAVLAVAGATGILSIALSRRWPALAGRLALTARSSVEQGQRRARAGIRQGILAGVAVAAMLALFLSGWLDLAIALVLIIFVGLVESFIQSRET